VTLLKQDQNCKTSVAGVSFTTLNSFEMLFIFATRLQKISSLYTDNLAVQLSLDNYKHFIKNISKNATTEQKQQSSGSVHTKQQQEETKSNGFQRPTPMG
jgi:hypothetical protein